MPVSTSTTASAICFSALCLAVDAVVTRTYTYGLQRISEKQYIEGAWVPSFYEYDGAGSVRQLTSSTGAVTDTYEYDAFGNSFTVTGSTPNNYLYRGEQYDSDLGLYYLRARYYNPATGRFMSRDPEDGKAKIPATLHKYLYASGDPINGIDPSGRADEEEEGLIVRFTTHGLDHLVEEGLELTQPEVEAYVEMLARQFASIILKSGNVSEFWFQFAMEELGGVPWVARVFIISSAAISVGTYYPLP
jgi:RHS repeat-associated protein